jgi:homoserine kinase
MTRFRIEVPATSANLGPGFDTLGLALDIVNTIEVELTSHENEVVLAHMTGDTSEALDRHENLLCAAYRRWGEERGMTLPGARFTVETRIPTARGLGASAAAIVAGLAAGAEAAGEKQPRAAIVRLSSVMEGHADNAVAATLGGLTTAFIDGGCVHALQVVTHLSLGVALFIPDVPLRTSEARALLPDSIARRDAIFNVNRVSYLVTALMWGRWELIGPAMEDCLHQPYRSTILPALDDLIAAARGAGAYGAALSGGGPSVIALGPRECSESVARAMRLCAEERGWSGRCVVTGIRHLGVQVTRENE